jgi:DNA-binding NarL/FixJ family response regulator
MPRKPAARLIIADDHKLLADAIKSVLEPEFEVVEIVTDGRALLKSTAASKPDLIIADISMPHLNGLDAAEQIKHKMPSVKIIFLTMNSSAEVAAEAFRRGASAFVLKQSAAEELVSAVRQVMRGESYLSPIIARETVTFLLNQGAGAGEQKKITKRQNEILQLLAEGMSMKQVAAELDLQPGTVAFHKYRMMEVLGIKSNAELLEYAIKNRIGNQ